MKLILLIFSLLAPAAWAGQLVVRIDPRWDGKPLVLDAAGLTTAAGEKISLTRLAFLLSQAKLQRADGTWIGAQDWTASIDVAKARLTFTLPDVPPERYTAVRFDLGLDEATDHSDPAGRAVGHPLHPDFNGLHWGWRGGYVFCAIEGRYAQADGGMGGFSYHLAGQACRGTVEIPVEMDLRADQLLTLSFDAERIFSARHRIMIAAAETTHSGEDGGLASRMADNAVQAFGVVAIMPATGPRQAGPAAPSNAPELLRGRIPSHFPQALWPQDNPLTEAGLALGAELFRDPRLSITNTQSCSSCHQLDHGMAEARQVSRGAEGLLGTRNAMPLSNLAWKPGYFWDGRAATLREQVLVPIQDPREMHELLDRVAAKIADRAPQFQAAFGDATITAERIAMALEQFLLSLVAANSKLDRALTRNEPLSAEEQRGFTLFFTESDPARGIKGADCFHCHGGAQLTNYQFLNNGLDRPDEMLDEGRARITKQPADRAKFAVPSLRNVALTAPYMHDGRFATLEEVIDHYNSGVKASPTLDPNLAKHLRFGGLGLDRADKQALIAFLHALSEE